MSTYKVTVKTSASGALSGDTGSTITIVLPDRNRPDQPDEQLRHGRHHPVRRLHDIRRGTTASCFIYSGESIPASSTVVITLAGVKNPATAATYTAKVTTTSDVTVKTSTGYCVVAAGVPCIATVAPASGGIGTSVTITGVNLSGATVVAFHGTSATILTNTATKITTTVPVGATTGAITVMTGAGTATSPASFTVVPAPGVSGFTPPSGPVGTTVTISGSNLAKATGVTFNGTSTTIITDTATQITVKVPTGATTGKIAVKTAGGTGTSATNFTVT